MPADGGGDGNTFDRGDNGDAKFDWPAFVFFVKFDDPVKFNVNLSPPFLRQCTHDSKAYFLCVLAFW